MRIVAIIPARFQSSRFPGKPLAPILGIPLIKRVYSAVKKSALIENIFVATDSKKIADYLESQEIPFLMTSESCPTGTDRVYAASKMLGFSDDDIVVNVQGDEPMVKGDDIDLVIQKSKQIDSVVNGYCVIKKDDAIRSPSVPKMIIGPNGQIIYISRSVIPSDKNGGISQDINYYRQVCIYAMPFRDLKLFGNVERKGVIEQSEDIEMLRFLELNTPIFGCELSSGSLAVDYREDIVAVEKALRAMPR